jgi:DNA topoisomerase VI subunit B
MRIEYANKVTIIFKEKQHGAQIMTYLKWDSYKIKNNAASVFKYP